MKSFYVLDGRSRRRCLKLLRRAQAAGTGGILLEHDHELADAERLHRAGFAFFAFRSVEGHHTKHLIYVAHLFVDEVAARATKLTVPPRRGLW